MAGTFTGGFSQFDAVVTDGVLTGSTKIASVQVKDPDLAAHLQSPEFFDAERYPELAFESNAIERTRNRIRIDGEITIKGHAEPVRIIGDITDTIADPILGAGIANGQRDSDGPHVRPRVLSPSL